MKKNITINLAGQLFAIDEDAYELLLNYTETLRRYYRRQAEGEEVVDDIEARIAELMNELKAQGYNAITIEHVQNIIQRIGRLEDITGGENSGNNSHTADAEADADIPGTAGTAQSVGNSLQDAWNKVRNGKRFYRDTENKMLGGVLAGCAKYFGGDVVIWRIVFLCLLLFPLPFVGKYSGTLVVIYIIMAIIAPAASTPEERLKMRGEEVNPQNLAEEVNRETTAYNNNELRAQRRHTMSVICAVILIIFSVWMWIGFVGVMCGAGALYMAPELMSSNMFGGEREAPSEAVTSIIFSILYILAAVELCLFVLGYCSMHTGLSLLGKVKSMGLKERILWLFIFACSVVGITMTGVNCAANVKSFENEYPYVQEQAEAETSFDDIDTDTICADTDTICADIDTTYLQTETGI